MELNRAEFINNVSNTCHKQDALIASDGKEFGFFDRIKEFFFGKKRSEHFLEACKNLDDVLPSKEFQNLNGPQKLEILGRIHQIQNSILSPKEQSNCNELIAHIDDTILADPEERQKLITDFFDSFNNDLNDKNYPSLIKHAEEIMDAVVKSEHCDENDIKLIINKWKEVLTSNSFIVSGNITGSNLFRNFDRQLSRILIAKNNDLINVQTQLLNDVNGDDLKLQNRRSPMVETQKQLVNDFFLSQVNDIKKYIVFFANGRSKIDLPDKQLRLMRDDFKEIFNQIKSDMKIEAKLGNREYVERRLDGISQYATKIFEETQRFYAPARLLELHQLKDELLFEPSNYPKNI
ncbi:MAG: hypothetical protein H0U49_11045 [Parachlamydiaceae bacterium]|nr:hypothetical protein [Parachlamydiaceae bacterium]